MVRHTTEGVVYDARTHTSTRFDPAKQARVDRWVQEVLPLDTPDDEDVIPF